MTTFILFFLLNSGKGDMEFLTACIHFISFKFLMVIDATVSFLSTDFVGWLLMNKFGFQIF